MYTDMYLSLQYHTEDFYCCKILSALSIHSSLPKLLASGLFTVAIVLLWLSFLTSGPRGLCNGHRTFSV